MSIVYSVSVGFKNQKKVNGYISKSYISLITYCINVSKSDTNYEKKRI